MDPTTKTLREYQEKLVFNVCRATGDVLVEQPTGSGKTVQIVTLVAMHLGKRFTHAVISAPQEQIEQGFVKRDYNVVAFPERPGVAVPSIQVPKQTDPGGARQQTARLREAHPRLPSRSRPARPCLRLHARRLEPHHRRRPAGRPHRQGPLHRRSPPRLGRRPVANRDAVARARRPTVLLHGDALSRRRPAGEARRHDAAYRRSLAEHMAEGFAPRHLDSEIVALGQPGDAITAAQFTGEEAPPASYFEALVAAICRRWRDDGKPKAIVRVPPMQGGKSGELVRRFDAGPRWPKTPAFSTPPAPAPRTSSASWPDSKPNSSKPSQRQRST